MTIHNNRGFTIVELLIVIVVIAILAAISIVAYNSIQQRANNTSTQQGVANFLKVMKAYAQVNNNTYPGPGTTACIKDDKNNNLCSEYSTGAATCFGTGGVARSSGFETTLATVATTPTVSSQSMTCGGQQYRGAFVNVAATGKSGEFYVYYKGNISPCLSVGGMAVDARFQQDDTTFCIYALPVL